MKKLILIIFVTVSLLLAGCVSINPPSSLLEAPQLPLLELPSAFVDELLEWRPEAEPPVQPEISYFTTFSFEEAVVSRIIDGDTIAVIMADGTEERVRFIGVDAPEMNFRSDEPPEEGAQEATDFVAALIPPGETIWMEQLGNDRDRFERLRRYIWIEHPIDPDAQRKYLTVNRLLLKYGHAVVWGQ